MYFILSHLLFVSLLIVAHFISVRITDKSSTENYPGFEEVHIESNQDESDDDSCNSNSDDDASQKTTASFLDELSHRAIEAAERSDKVVVRYVTNSSQDCQEPLVKRLIRGGASDENITVVRLTMDQNCSNNKRHRSGSFYRTNYCNWRPKTMAIE